jgi:hypothetical protein
MPILWQTITWLGIFVVTLSVAALMRIGGFNWPATIFAAIVTFLVLPFVINQWRGNMVARPRGNVLPTTVDKSTTDAASKDPSTFLQGFESVPTEALRSR